VNTKNPISKLSVLFYFQFRVNRFFWVPEQAVATISLHLCRPRGERREWAWVEVWVVEWVGHRTHSHTAKPGNQSAASRAALPHLSPVYCCSCKDLPVGTTLTSPVALWGGAWVLGVCPALQAPSCSGGADTPRAIIPLILIRFLLNSDSLPKFSMFSLYRYIYLCSVLTGARSISLFRQSIPVGLYHSILLITGETYVKFV